VTTPAPNHCSVPRRIVGRYAIFEPIASGGMASVHLGRLMGPVGFSRTVAIKRLHENYARDPEFVAMFLDEARIVARIRHPNVVPTLDVVALEHELLLVMEYISGASLSALLKQAASTKKPTPIPIVVDIMVNVLNGLHAAHEATNEKGEPLNIVHRDVSPQNVLVGTDGVSRVLDFGVAKAVGRTQHTHAGQVKGKVRYMAPENLACLELTRAADIYSASIMLWEALTGRRLFDGDNDPQIIQKMMAHRIEPPSRFRPEIPRALDEIVMRGLRRRPTDRHATAREMAVLLEATVPPVRRSAVAAWVMENAGDEIQMREARVMDVEGDVPSVRSAEAEISFSDVKIRGPQGEPNEMSSNGPRPRAEEISSNTPRPHADEMPTTRPMPNASAAFWATLPNLSATWLLRHWRRSWTYVALCLLSGVVAVVLSQRLQRGEQRPAAQASAMAQAPAGSAPIVAGPTPPARALASATTSLGPDEVGAEVVVPTDSVRSSPKTTRRGASQAIPVKPAAQNGKPADRLYQRD